MIRFCDRLEASHAASYLIKINETKNQPTYVIDFSWCHLHPATTDMADKGKNHETGSPMIPLDYTVYEADDGVKFLIPQFIMLNATKLVQPRDRQGFGCYGFVTIFCHTLCFSLLSVTVCLYMHIMVRLSSWTLIFLCLLCLRTSVSFYIIPYDLSSYLVILRMDH